MEFAPEIVELVKAQPYPLVFVTISGAHLYGFPSADSDYDLRGVHVLPVSEAVGLDAGRETIEVSCIREKLEMDLVTHDARKFFLLMLRKNGYVLEQLYSPMVVRSSAEHDELKSIGRACITKNHAHHYIGFAQRQWRLFETEIPRRVKPLLYVFRVLLTGIHLMRTGEVEANLVALNARYPLPYLPELIARKQAGTEQQVLAQTDVDFFAREYDRLMAELHEASERSSLPKVASAKPALNDLLIRLREKFVERA